MAGRIEGGITDRSPDFDRRIDEWRKIRDCIEGEDRIKQQRNFYLPKPKAQDLEQYDRYIQRSSFYAVCDRTVRGLVGLVFRVNPRLDLPEAIDGIEDFATPEGNPLETLIRDALREVLSLGRYGLLVDMPTQQVLPGDAIPYIAPYQAEAIWRWDEVLNPATGKRTLVRLILEEEPATNQGTAVTWLRELFLEIPLDDEGVPTGLPIYKQQLWRTEEAEGRADKSVATGSRSENTLETEGFDRFGDEIVPLRDGRPLNEIPFWFVNTYNLLARPEKPPMLDLANVNLAHWRNSADYEQLLHKVGQPTPWAAYNHQDGEAPNSIGSNSFWLLPEGAQVGLLEVSGQGAQAFERSMDRKEQHMAALGASLIRNQERANVTAETTRLQKTGEISVLSSAVQNVEMAVKLALRFAAGWAGAPEAEIDELKAELNQDFFDTKMEPAQIQALVAAWQSGAFSKETLHAKLQEGEVIAPDRTFEEEQEAIEREAEDFGVASEEVPSTEEEPVEEEVPAEEPDAETAETRQGEETTPGGSDDHRHAIVDGVAIAETPGGRALDHEHDPATATSDSETSGRHAHPEE